MTSKLETRIITQKYHGISSAAWWKLTDEEQEALIREATECAFCGAPMTANDNPNECNHAEGKGGGAAADA